MIIADIFDRFLAARRGSTGRAALKAVSRALREQARALGLPAAAPG